MPKLSATGDTSDAIVRVEINAETLVEKNEDGSWKFDDSALKDWLVKLRGDRELVMAKKEAKAAGGPATPRASTKQVLTEDDLDED